MDKATKMRIDFLNSNYYPLEVHHLNKHGKIYLGDKGNKLCRFCKRKDGETTFKNESLNEFNEIVQTIKTYRI